MAMTMRVHVVSAEELIFSGVGTMVCAPAEMGEVGILPRHAPLVTRLKPGRLLVRLQHDEEMSFVISGGILEVLPHVVSVLVESAVRADDLDEAAKLEATRRLAREQDARRADFDYARAQSALADSIARLREGPRVSAKRDAHAPGPIAHATHGREDDGRRKSR